MKIAVFGAGGIGGYFGGKLAAGGADVHLIARGRHLDALRRDGLTVLSAMGDVSVDLPASAEPENVGVSDVVLFCVKATDTKSAARQLTPLLGENTAVVTLQNGVDNEEVIGEIVGPGHVVGGVAYILATISRPGTITHQGSMARIVFGELDGRRSERMEALAEICRQSGIEAELSETIRSELWRKFAVICATAGMTSAVRLPLGEIRSSRAAFEMYRQMVEEVVSVAAAVGIVLSGDTVERIMKVAASLPGEWYSSLHYDLTHGKPMELDALHGTVVRLARQHGVSVPMCEAVYGTLEPWAIRNASSKSRRQASER